jgi:hypothetical protein
MNIFKTLRDGVHDRGGNGRSPAESPPDASAPDASPPDAGRHPDDHDPPSVVANGLPIKAKPESVMDA